jgi:hypothetical protein
MKIDVQSMEHLKQNLIKKIKENPLSLSKDVDLRQEYRRWVKLNLLINSRKEKEGRNNVLYRRKEFYSRRHQHNPTHYSRKRIKISAILGKKAES